MVEKKLKEVIQYYNNYQGKITIITKDGIIGSSTHNVTAEMLEKKVRSSQLNCGHLTVWMEL